MSARALGLALLAAAAMPAWAAAAAEPAPTVTGAGRCVVTIGAAETTCTQAGLVRSAGGAELDVVSESGHMVLSGALTAPSTAAAPSLMVTAIDYGLAHHAPAEGRCAVALSADGKAITDIDCETFSAFGEIRMRFIVPGLPE